jgi:hypothetical protein
MRHHHAATVFCCVAFLLTGASISWGQEPSRRATKKLPCGVGDVTFACPEGFKPVPLESERKLALFFREDYGLGFFVVAPEAGFDGPKFVADLRVTMLAKLFPEEKQAYAWRELDFVEADLLFNSTRMSKFQVARRVSHGFNGASRVVFGYRHIKFKGRGILVGYVFEADRGTEAKEKFGEDELTDSMPGCRASLDVIN